MRCVNPKLLMACLGASILLAGCQKETEAPSSSIPNLDDVSFPVQAEESSLPPAPATLPDENEHAPDALDLSSASLTYFDNTSLHGLGGQWNGYGVHYPSVLKFGGQYYLYASTPDSNIGIRAYTSSDLVSWVPVTGAGYPLGYICKQRETFGLKAPRVIFHEDHFYLYGNTNYGYRIFESTSPEGPFQYWKDLGFACNYQSSIYQAPNGKLFFVTGGDEEAYLYEMRDIDTIDFASKSAIPSTRIIGSSGYTAIVESPSLALIDDTLYLTYSSQQESFSSYHVNVVAATQPDFSDASTLAESFYNNQLGPILLSSNPMDESQGFGDVSIVEGPDMASYYACYTTRESDDVRHFNVSPVTYSKANLALAHRLTHEIACQGESLFVEDIVNQDRILSDDVSDVFNVDCVGEDLKAFYFGFASANNTYVIRFAESSAMLLKRVNGMEQNLASMAVTGHCHEIKIAYDEQLNVTIDGVSLIQNYLPSGVIAGKIGYEKGATSKIDGFYYSLVSKHAQKQEAFHNAESSVFARNAYLEASNLTGETAFKTITSDANFKNEEALVLANHRDYARFLVDVREAGYYGLELIYNAAFGKYRCALGLRAGAHDVMMYTTSPIADKGYVRNLTAEFSLQQGVQEIYIENLSNMAFELVSFCLKKVRNQIPEFSDSLSDYATHGVYYVTDFLVSAGYQSHQTYEGARSFAYVGDDTIADAVYEAEVAFGPTLVISGYVSLGFRCDDYASTRVDNDESAQGYFLEISQFQIKLVKHNYGYGKTFGTKNLSNSIGAFSNYIIKMSGNHITVYREELLVFDVVDPLAFTTGHLGFGAADTCGLIRNIHVHGEGA